MLGSSLGFAYIAWTVDLTAVFEVLKTSPAGHFAGAMGVTGAALWVGAFRWRAMLAAYGAPHRPGVARLAHVYAVGFFYNTYLPGGVGGDVVRGIATREAFGEEGTTRAMTVVLVERLLGLAGLFAVVAGVLVVAPPMGLEPMIPYALVAIAAVLAGVAGIGFARRLSSRLGSSNFIARRLAALPELVSFPHLLLGFVFSLGTQSLVAVTGFVVLSGITPDITLAQTFVVVPVVAASAFLPFTVGGAGAREAAFVAMCAVATDVNETDATAASLLLWATQLAVAGLGGVLQVARPIR